MKGKLRVTFALPPALEERSKGNALAILKDTRGVAHAQGRGGDDEQYVSFRSKSPYYAFAEREAAMVADKINEVLDRFHYAMDTPDAALSFVDGKGVLIDADDSGIDHETLFRLGRVAR